MVDHIDLLGQLLYLANWCSCHVIVLGQFVAGCELLHWSSQIVVIVAGFAPMAGCCIMPFGEAAKKLLKIGSGIQVTIGRYAALGLAMVARMGVVVVQFGGAEHRDLYQGGDSYQTLSLYFVYTQVDQLFLHMTVHVSAHSPVGMCVQWSVDMDHACLYIRTCAGARMHGTSVWHRCAAQIYMCVDLGFTAASLCQT